jgi:beta-glucanase (GH16 family)
VSGRANARSRSPGKIVLAVCAALVIGLVGVVVVQVEYRSDWSQVFAEDFDEDVPLGRFPGAGYGQRWTGYDGLDDTSGQGLYAPSEVLSVHDGTLDYHLHTRNGQPLGAAPSPVVSTEWTGQVYGKFTVRFKSDPVPGFGVAWLLWPDSNDWQEGEFDFPEADLTGTIHANQHCVGDPERNCLAADTGVPFSSGWHTTSIEWTPAGVVYILDGQTVARSSESPRTSFHLVLQTETKGDGPDPAAEGHILVDFVRIYRWR